MSEASKAARAAMKKKIERITADPHEKVDASDWSPPEPLNTEGKTGLRPVSPRAFKKGGKVVAMKGEKSRKNAGRKARANGGKLANEIVNRNVKDANAEFGKPHVGGYKKGGKTKRPGKDLGGIISGAQGLFQPGGTLDIGDRALGAASKGVGKLASMISTKKNGGAAANYTGGTRPKGGRIARKSGGRAKGKTNINIIIGGGGHKEAEMPPSAMAPTRPPMPMPPPAPPPQAAPPMPLPGAGAGMPPPPMARKSGGRVGNRRYASFKDMDAGAGGGLGRLEKTEIQSKR